MRRCEICEREQPSTVFRMYRGEPGTECDKCRNRLEDFRRYEKLFAAPATPKQFAILCKNLAEEMVMEGITLKKIKEAKLGELSRSIDTFWAIGETLEGRPTRIISYKAREHRDDLLRALKEAIEAKGQTIDVTPIHGDDDDEQRVSTLASLPTV